ncbi:MAG: hypothetical protein K9K93_07920 [Acholeplasmataceae bacterium]|nr:hypothetical protein [Acholeplasmataceae bacterium]
MKKVSTILISVFLVFVFSGEVYANDVQPSSVIIDEVNYTNQNDNLVLYGNFASSISLDVKSKLDEGLFVMSYDLHREKNTRNDFPVATIKYNSNGVRYTKTLSTNEKNPIELSNDIEEFANDFMNSFVSTNNRAKPLSSLKTMSAPEDFVSVEVESGEQAFKPYGKIVFVSVVYMSEADPDFNIYMVDTSAEFIPGIALKNLGDNDYQNWHSEQSRQITNIQRVTRVYYHSVTYGETPNVLEYWPKNYPVIRTISTSFGIGATLGVSQADGFKGELTGNFGYSQSYTEESPNMSASTLVVGEEYGWYFEGFNPTTKIKTLHFQSGQMVEMENGAYIGQFSLQHDFWFQVDRFWGSNKYLTFTPSRTIYAYD